MPPPPTLLKVRPCDCDIPISLDLYIISGSKELSLCNFPWGGGGRVVLTRSLSTNVTAAVQVASF